MNSKNILKFKLKNLSIIEQNSVAKNFMSDFYYQVEIILSNLDKTIKLNWNDKHQKDYMYNCCNALTVSSICQLWAVVAINF